MQQELYCDFTKEDSIINNEELNTKDIISVVLMSLVNIFIFGFSTLLYFNPFTILLMPVYFALAQGIAYFMLGTKDMEIQRH